MFGAKPSDAKPDEAPKPAT
jgi:hypothetical protein